MATSSNPVSPKVTVATIAGAITVLLVYILGEVGVDLTTEVSSAVTVLIMAVFAYFKRDPRRDEVVVDRAK